MLSTYAQQMGLVSQGRFEKSTPKFLTSYPGTVGETVGGGWGGLYLFCMFCFLGFYLFGVCRRAFARLCSPISTGTLGWVALERNAHVPLVPGIEHRVREQYSSLTGGNFWIYRGRCVRYALVGGVGSAVLDMGANRRLEKRSEVLALKSGPKTQPISLGMFRGKFHASKNA